MQADKILNANLLDILFEGKNKEYGAYELRKTYNKRIALAIISMATMCMLFFLSQLFANDTGRERNKIPVTTITLENIKEPAEKLPEPPKVLPPKVEVPKFKTLAFTPPVITKDDDVKNPPPAIDQLAETKIGLTNQDGMKEDDLVAPPIEQSMGIVEGPKKPEEDIDKIFTRVEKEAKFPGGMEAWKRYLERNLNGNIAADQGAPTGKYTVKVQFIVDREGSISNVQTIEVPTACPGCGLEAVNVIKKGPKWEPAIQNGRKVVYQAVQSVTFEVSEE